MPGRDTKSNTDPYYPGTINFCQAFPLGFPGHPKKRTKQKRAISSACPSLHLAALIQWLASSNRSMRTRTKKAESGGWHRCIPSAEIPLRPRQVTIEAIRRTLVFYSLSASVWLVALTRPTHNNVPCPARR